MSGIRPYSLRGVQQNPLARMLPLHFPQRMVYRMAEKLPPSNLSDHGPSWEVVDLNMAALDTLQVRVNLQRDYHLLAITASSSSVANGGFRAQFYDAKKQRRMMDRGLQFANLAGSSKAALFLREPDPFPEPDGQILVVVQNFEAVTNNVQIVFYGQAMRFNAGTNNKNVFPGGSITSATQSGTSKGGSQ